MENIGGILAFLALIILPLTGLTWFWLGGESDTAIKIGIFAPIGLMFVAMIVGPGSVDD